MDEASIPFQNRAEAGRLLASKLIEFADRKDVVVLALPRGGVPVAAEVAKDLQAPLDILVVRKLGVPGQEELAMGALASGGVAYLNQEVITSLGIPPQAIELAISSTEPQVDRREREYREGRPAIEVRGRAIILVDDGLATGSSMRAAVAAVRRRDPAQIVVAVPVASRSTCLEFQRDIEHVVCASTPEPFWAVGQWYRDFSQTSDEEVRDMLRRAWEAPAQAA